MSPADPCVKLCVADPLTGLCIGCGRTASEIAAWAALDSAAQARLLAALPGRLAAMTSRRVRKEGRNARPTAR